MNTTIHKAK